MIWILFYLLLLIFISIFSYIFTDPNLFLFSHPFFTDFQYKMWQFLDDRVVLSIGYVLVVVSMFYAYWRALLMLKAKKISFAIFSKQPLLRQLLIVILPSVILLFGYNSLSHDVFNYIFNSKMVIEYGHNPHVSVALNFPDDDWTRFMHNTHTPAPYGYGWTIISLLPYWLGLGFFSLTWIMYRLFSILSLVLFFLVVRWWYQQKKETLEDWHLFLLFWNPLVILEIVLNSHNDFWMLWPAVLSIGLLRFKKDYIWIFVSAMMLSLSIFIKLATAVLVPVWLFIFIINKFDLSRLILLMNRSKIVFFRKLSDWSSFASKNHFLSNKLEHISLHLSIFKNKVLDFISIYLSSFLLFLPLLSERSKMYLPWYLTWSLCWIILIGNSRLSWWWQFLLVSSFAAMMRYVPRIYAGGFFAGVGDQQFLILWGISLLYFVYNIGNLILKKYYLAFLS